MISSKYFSKIAITLTSAVLILCILAMVFSDKLLMVMSDSAYAMEYETELFDTDNVIEINILMDAEKWNEMLNNATQEVYYECDVVINGTTFYQVGIRPKGNTSLSSIAKDPDNNRYSFKLEFDQFVDGQTCFGLDKLILNNSYADTTNMKEAVIYDMFRFLDADSSLYNYANISVNNEYWGVYLALEAIEESFMLRNYGTQQGYLYKPDSMNFNNGKDDKKSSGGNFPSMPEGDFKMPEGGFKMPEGGFNNPEGNNSQQRRKPPEGFSENSENNGESQHRRSRNPSEKSSENSSGKSSNRGFPGGGAGPGMMGGGARPGGARPGMMGGGASLNYSDDNLDSYSTIWNAQVNNSADDDHKRVVEALKNVHSETNIEKYIDVEQVLKYMAVHNFSVNEDSLSGSMAHNYYLYEANGQISILPWDYNLSLGGMHGGTATSVINEPIDDTWQGTQLFDFVLENEEYKARYHEYYEKLVNEYFYGGEFDKTYNRIRLQIDSLAQSDPNSMYTYDEYIKGVEILYDVVMLRAESIKGQLDGSIPSTADGQKSDSASLIDASHINLSDLGQFNIGGGFGGGGGFGKGPQSSSNKTESESQKQ